MDRTGRTARPLPSQDDEILDQDPATPAQDDVAGDDAGDDDSRRVAPARRFAPDDYCEAVNEQADFREHFDEDLYTDREDRPAQGNTADVAMGSQRFGTDADAYAEYAWRRPGDHHHGEESAVGQSRDPADSRGRDTPR